MKQSSKNKRHKKKVRNQLFEELHKLAHEVQEQAVMSLSPKMRLLFERWKSEQ